VEANFQGDNDLVFSLGFQISRDAVYVYNDDNNLGREWRHYWAWCSGISSHGLRQPGSGVPFEVNGGIAISLHDVQSILKFQGTTIRPSDILVFRTGRVDWYKTTEPSTRHDVLYVQNRPGAHRLIA
jgi:hypothetical protein